MTLYEFFNAITGEGYVGITHRPVKFRKREHLYELKAGRNGFNMANITAVCRDRARSHNGYVWCYADLPNYKVLIENKLVNFISSPPKTGVRQWL